jgi:hypothetical protein
MDDESKKDTVRINLPPNVTGRPPQKPGSATQPVKGSDVTQPLTPPPSAVPARPVMPDVTQPIIPPGTTQPISAPEALGNIPEAKKETAVMGKPPATPSPKADTSRVQVPSVKAADQLAESPRPTVKLRRETDAAAAAVPVAATSAPASPAMAAAPAAAGPSGIEVGLSVASMVLSLAVAGYLAFLMFGQNL